MDRENINEITIPKNYNNYRLDQVISKIIPNLGIRGVKRLILNGKILYNDKKVLPHIKVKEGYNVKIVNEDQKINEFKVIQENDSYIFILKPSGINSSHVIGGGISVEDNLKIDGEIVQRLDRDTSGILCIAKNLKAKKFFKCEEKKGNCEKKYIAFLEGVLDEEIVVKRDLDIKNRSKSKILNSDADKIRHTYFEPLIVFDDRYSFPFCPFKVTLVGVKILCGYRHQIRAHAAFLGYPLVNDILYGAKIKRDIFYLHHAGLYFSNIKCTNLPNWDINYNALIKIKKFLGLK